MAMPEADLSGYTVAVPEARELDVFAAMLERRGAVPLRCPLVAIHDAPDPAPVLDWLRWFSDGGCDDLVLLTGEGLRRLLRCIETHAPEMHDPFVAALGGVRTITRGPKPGRVLRTLGLRPGIVAEQPTTAGVIATLSREALAGRRVGVQLYGTEPNRPLIDFLTGAGAEVRTVAPYVYADAAEAERVEALIGALAGGEVDAIAFTSMAQVARLFRVARGADREAELRTGLERCTVAAVGPVVADTLREHGVEVDAMPGEAFFLKPLTSAIATLLADQQAPDPTDD